MLKYYPALAWLIFGVLLIALSVATFGAKDAKFGLAIVTFNGSSSDSGGGSWYSTAGGGYDSGSDGGSYDSGSSNGGGGWDSGSDSGSWGDDGGDGGSGSDSGSW